MNIALLMKAMNRALVTLVVSGAIAVGTAACGGSSLAGESTPPPSAGTSPSPAPLATPQELALNENGYFVFVSGSSGNSISFQSYPYTLANFGPFSVDIEGALYALTNGGVAVFAPRSALPTETVPASLIYPSSFYTNPFNGRHYFLNGNNLTEYSSGSPATAPVLRQITVKPASSSSPIAVAADKRGIISLLYSNGTLGFIPAGTSGTVTPTLATGYKFSTKADTSSVLSVDSGDNIYLFDGAVSNQVDIGHIDNGAFLIKTTLIDSALSSSTSSPSALAIDNNDSLYLFSPTGQVDFFRYGSAGAKNADITFAQPLKPCCGIFAAAIPGSASLPTPPPAPKGIIFSPASVTLSSASPSQHLTVSEPQFGGSFSVIGGSCLNENANPHTIAYISPQQGQSFTVSANFAVPGTCGIGFADGQGATATINVTISP